MTPPPDLADKDALIATLLARIETLTAANGLLIARIAELESKLDQPPKTPDNSSVPPSKGQKASESSKPKPKSKPHAGSHRALHPHPTRHHPVFACRCQGCGADVSHVSQSPCETYDRIEIPKIEPDVTQVSLYGGVCPGCAQRFKAEPPEGLEPGSPFGPNLRAFVIYLRSVQNIPLARLSDVLRDLLGLVIRRVRSRPDPHAHPRGHGGRARQGQAARQAPKIVGQAANRAGAHARNRRLFHQRSRRGVLGIAPDGLPNPWAITR